MNKNYLVALKEIHWFKNKLLVGIWIGTSAAVLLAIKNPVLAVVGPPVLFSTIELLLYSVKKDKKRLFG